MIPRYRAWDKDYKKMLEIENMNWSNGEFESIGYGLTSLRAANKIELMQSTGLKDKDGKEVFVGDIIKCTRGCLHEVYIEKEYGGTYFGGMPAVYLKDLREGYAWTEHEEIIGNIWEDGDLIDGKKTSEN